MKRFSWSRLATSTAIGLALVIPALRADVHNKKTVISISQPLEVPGAVLPPGTYVMKLLDSPSNRQIVQFMNERQNQQLALTFAIAAERIRPAENTLLTMYEGSQGAPPALRTWFYPGDTVGREFLYPHRQAVRIAERTNEAVPEVETAQAISATETAATSATQVPTEEPLQNIESPEAPVLIARAEPAPEPIPAPAPTPIAAPEPQQPAAEPESPDAAQSLPQTASKGPLAALLGGLSLILAGGVRKLKRSRMS